MRQKATIIVLIGTLIFSQLAAADPAGQGPLAPGRPAGAKAAQIDRNDVLIIAAGVLVVVVGLYLASGTYSIPGQSSGGNGSNVPATSSP